VGCLIEKKIYTARVKTMMPLIFLVVVVLIPVLAYWGIGGRRVVYGVLCAVTAIIFFSAFAYPGPNTKTLASANSLLANIALTGFIGSLLGVCFFKKKRPYFRSLSRQMPR
jgi:hypothetical protein